MKAQEIKDEWIHVGENDPPPDLSREEAAYNRERERLVRDHLGQIAVIRFDDIVGVYKTLEEATLEAHRQFGWGRMIFWQISDDDEEPEWIANVDINHPSFQRIDQPLRDGSWENSERPSQTS